MTIVFTFFKIMSHYKMTGGEEVSMRCHNLDYMSMIKDVIFCNYMFDMYHVDSILSLENEES